MTICGGGDRRGWRRGGGDTGGPWGRRGRRGWERRKGAETEKVEERKREVGGEEARGKWGERGKMQRASGEAGRPRTWCLELKW